MTFLASFWAIALLVIGFGFVIFWHELGHFLAAKWVGIRVEQFAVGMGHAVLSYRRGIGLKLGSTRAEYERRAKAQLEKQGIVKKEYTDEELWKAGDELGLGETEYRISWIPLGGYVKMMGQDDMDPTKQFDDPRAYNKKSVGARMLVISAGVIMNVILAGILFVALFLMGFRSPAPLVGAVLTGSPAQEAGVEVGDELVTFDGKPMHDFSKLMLETALSRANQDVKLVVRRSGQLKELTVRPRRASSNPKAFVSIGMGMEYDFTGPKEDPKQVDPQLETPNVRDIKAGDIIIAVNGIPVKRGDPQKRTQGDWIVFDKALQQATPARPMVLTVRSAQNQERQVTVRPHLPTGSFAVFGEDPVTYAGMEPRMSIGYIASANSPAYNQAKSGDAIAKVTVYPNAGGPGDPVYSPTHRRFLELMRSVGENNQTFDLTLQRDAKPVELKGLKPIKLEKAGWGLGVYPIPDENSAVVGSVTEGSAAAKAGIPAGAALTKVNNIPVRDWFEVRTQMLAVTAKDVEIEYTDPTGKTSNVKLALDDATRKGLAEVRLQHHLLLGEFNWIRQTSSPATAMSWGVTETRDLILQFYVTIQRMISGDVSSSNLMGPLGIFGAGAKFAFRGNDWLVWFLAMISANLAVVNFLPIPIVDGGHFVFLCYEKLAGKPPSRKVQEYAQLVGLVLILGLFLFVTYNDIARMAGWQ